jgi:hypothetical protein
MIGRRLHLGLDATSVSDGLSFTSRPKGYLEKHLYMIPIDIDKEHHVCLMYRSTRVYDYNTAIDWLILIARPLSTITLRDRSSDDIDGSWEELLRILWLNGRKEKRKKSNRKVEFTINL